MEWKSWLRPRREFKVNVELVMNMDVAKQLNKDTLEGEVHQMLISQVGDITKKIIKELKKEKYR